MSNPADRHLLDLNVRDLLDRWYGRDEVFARKSGYIASSTSALADDYIITVEDGSTFSKPGYIAHNGNATVHVEISEAEACETRSSDGRGRKKDGFTVLGSMDNVAIGDSVRFA